MSDKCAPENEKKNRREKNFCKAEVNIIVDAIVKYDDILHGEASKRISKAKKEAIYRKICEKVNAVGYARRTPRAISKRWTDIKRRTKGKIVAAIRHTKKTGGGPPCSLKLTAQEEDVARTILPEQTHGLGGIDTAATESGKLHQVLVKYLLEAKNTFQNKY